MSARAAVLLFWSWVAAATVFLCFPGVLPFNRARPFVLGMPFIMAWVALWIVSAFVVFWYVDRVLDRHRKEGD